MQLGEHLKERKGEELEEDIKDELDAALQVVMTVMVVVMVMVIVMQDYHSRNIKKGIEVRYCCIQAPLLLLLLP